MRKQRIGLSPENCEICGAWCGEGGLCWDIHMVVAHPETRPAMVVAMKAYEESLKKGKKGKKQ